MNKNQLLVALNPYQGDTPKVLCVCSAGVLRSPTIATELAKRGYNTRAAGASAQFALIPLSQALVVWADHIVAVDEVEDQVRGMVSGVSEQYKPNILIVDIPDVFEYNDPALVEIVKRELDEVGLFKWK